MSRDVFVVCSLVVGVFLASHLHCAASSKDGFNIYKDLLRGKSEADVTPEENENAEKLVYFFRTPVLSKEGDGSATSQYKRAPDDYLSDTWNKRGPGSMLTWVLSSKPFGAHPDFRNLVSLLGMSGLIPIRRGSAAGRTAFVATMGKKSVE